VFVWLGCGFTATIPCSTAPDSMMSAAAPAKSHAGFVEPCSDNVAVFVPTSTPRIM